MDTIEPMAPAPQENPFSTPIDSQPGRGRRFALIGCLSIVGLLAFVVLGLSLFMYRGRSTVLPVVERFLNDVESQRYAEAYAQIGQRWKKAESFEKFQATFQRINETLGRHKSLSMEVYRTDIDPSGTIGTAGIFAEYPTGRVLISVHLLDVDGKWEIIGMNFGSKLLETQMKCPKCGNLVTISAKFCSQCGEPLGKPAAQPAPADTPPIAVPEK